MTTRQAFATSRGCEEPEQPCAEVYVPIANIGGWADLNVRAGFMQRFQQRSDRSGRPAELVDAGGALDLRHDQVGAARHVAHQVDELEHADDGAIAQHRHVAHTTLRHQQQGAEQERVVVDGHGRERGHLLDRHVERQRADEGGPGEIGVGHDAQRLVGAADQQAGGFFRVHPQRRRLHRRGGGDDDRRMEEGLPNLRHHQRRHPARCLAVPLRGETLAEPLGEPGVEGRVGAAEIQQQAARQQLRNGLLANLRGRRRGGGERRRRPGRRRRGR
jgi:hypothetical protein